MPDSLMARIMPSSVAVAECWGECGQAYAFPEEFSAVEKAAPKRRAEFARGRACAHNVLARLGYAPAPIGRGRRGDPLWPNGVVGSITHCGSYAAAAAAPDDRFSSLGIDAEIHEPLPSGTLQMISNKEELDMIRQLPRDGTWWGIVLFSAKESIFKAWYPIFRTWLGFAEAQVFIDSEGCRFSGKVVSAVGASGHLILEGRCCVDQGMVATSVVVGRAR